jgi:hypothetical protein
MTRHLRNALIVSVGVGALAVAAATVALASFAADPALEDLSGPVPAEADQGMAAPVAGAALFAASPKTAGACVTADTVVTRLQADRSAIGGETVMLADGLEQAFADAWRRALDLRPVAVSTVIAHVFRTEDVSGAMVDVVEVDTAGCAMTRTILSAEEWATLLGMAAGVGV